MASVTLEHVSCTFGDRRRPVQAVEDLHLHAADGEFTVLVGPSGCGKTTTLRLIAGLEVPGSGTIRIGDRVVNRVAPKDRDVAMVFQNYALYPHMTVFKNLAFGLKMRRVPKVEIRRKVEETAVKLGIAHLLDRRPGTLSGGEKQRVALGRAIVRTPQVFLFDEPLSNLDASLRLQMRGELKALHRDLQATVIHVTHDQEEAMTLGDRIAVLKDGAVQQFGTPLEVYQRPANRFVAGFIGAPPMNFVSGTWGRDAGSTFFTTDAGRVALPDSMSVGEGNHGPGVVLGIRPQHLRLVGKPVPEAPPSAKFVSLGECVVRFLELLGDSCNMHVSSPVVGDWVVRSASMVSVAAGERLTLGFDPAHAHFFAADPDGRRLGNS